MCVNAKNIHSILHNAKLKDHLHGNTLATIKYQAEKTKVHHIKTDEKETFCFYIYFNENVMMIKIYVKSLV